MATTVVSPGKRNQCEGHNEVMGYAGHAADVSYVRDRGICEELRSFWNYCSIMHFFTLDVLYKRIL